MVEGNVLRKRSLLIPAGSPVRGRVRRLEWHDEKGGYFIVALEFTEIENAGTPIASSPILRARMDCPV